ncbi:MAG: RuvX/YqgF family protein [bacterium]|nr:RuvX/YqgF family protein [bacterium]
MNSSYLPPKILAIDYGTERIGLAVNHGALADPLEIIANDSKLLHHLQSLCESEEIALVVVGISENEMARQTERFISELRQHITVPIETTDETLSSSTVGQKMKDAGWSLAKRQRPRDDLAAAEFLQEYLDTHQ